MFPVHIRQGEQKFPRFQIVIQNAVQRAGVCTNRLKLHQRGPRTSQGQRGPNKMVSRAQAG